MVKLVSAAAVILATAISAVQADFVLSAGKLTGTHTVSGVNCASALSFSKAKSTLKAGQVFCSFLPKVGMSLCQSHQADVTATNQDGFTADILNNIWVLGACSDRSGGVNFANDGTWINGFYSGSTFMSAARFSIGKVSNAQCSPFTCSQQSKGLSWRNLGGVSTNC